MAMIELSVILEDLKNEELDNVEDKVRKALKEVFTSVNIAEIDREEDDKDDDEKE